MHTKKLALAIYKRLPKFCKRAIVRTLFPTYIAAAKVYITNESGKFLVVKTTYHTGWDLPSGHLDKHESPDQAAVRELFEETGLKVDSLDQRAVIFEPLLGTMQVIFSGSLDHTPTLQPDNVEISELRWVERGEVECNAFALEALEVLLDKKLGYYVSLIDKH